MNDVAVDVRQAIVSPLEAMGESRVVDPHLVQQCCIKIVNMHGILDDVVAVVVGFSVNDPRANPAAG